MAEAGIPDATYVSDIENGWVYIYADKHQPIPESKLQQIAEKACEHALSSAGDYNHDEAENWNSSIINNVLKSLLAESQSTPKAAETEAETEADAPPAPKYKYAVTSTVIQNLDPPNTSSTGTSTTEDASEHATNGDVIQTPASGRRGMHSATGAYWNNSTDGMWTYKWDGADKRGCDVVLSVIWVQV